MLIDKQINEFLAELKSDSPAPGGGSAAALAGAVAAALGVMVGNLTVRSDKFADVHGTAEDLMKHLDEDLTVLERYIDEDTAEFTKVSAAYKLPKGSDVEKKQRSAAIQDALKGASCLPMKVADACLDVLELSVSMLEIGNPNAASDAAVAGRLAQAAMWSAMYNVKINLGSIKDADFVATMTKKVNMVIARADVSFEKLVALANEKI